jgi:hypothetical protein
MRWFKPNLRSSFFALLFGGGPPKEPTTVMQTYTLEDIRERMQAMAEAAGGPRAQQVVRRVRYASDVEALWFIRSELMALLAGAYGEVVALDKVDEVSEMFDDLLPEGLRSRPSPLGSSVRDAGRSDF